MTREEAIALKKAFYEWIGDNFSPYEIETIFDNVIVRSATLDQKTGQKKIVLSYLIETEGESFLKDEENDYFFYEDEAVPIEYKQLDEPIRAL